MQTSLAPESVSACAARIDAKSMSNVPLVVADSRISVPLHPGFDIMNKAGPEFDHWAPIVQDELAALRLRAQGLAEVPPSARHRLAQAREVQRWLARLHEVLKLRSAFFCVGVRPTWWTATLLHSCLPNCLLPSRIARRAGTILKSSLPPSP